MLTYHQWSLITSFWVQFHKRHFSHQSLKLAWNSGSNISFKSPREQWEKGAVCCQAANTSQLSLRLLHWISAQTAMPLKEAYPTLCPANRWWLDPYGRVNSVQAKNQCWATPKIINIWEEFEYLFMYLYLGHADLPCWWLAVELRPPPKKFCPMASGCTMWRDLVGADNRSRIKTEFSLTLK